MENTKNNIETKTETMDPALLSQLFEKDYHYITESDKVPPYAMRTFRMLMRFRGANEYCFPSHKTLSKKLGVTVQTVIRHINALVEAGVLEVHHQIRSDGGWGSNRYYLKTDFLSWITPKMLADKSCPFYKQYYDILTASGSNSETADGKSCTEKVTTPEADSSGTANTNVYDAKFVDEHYKLSELREEAEGDTYTAEMVDLMEHILLDVLNSDSHKVYNVKSLKPAVVVKSVFLKMTKFDILSTMREYVAYVKNLPSGKKICSPAKFIISMLYNNFLKARGNSINFDLTGEACY